MNAASDIYQYIVSRFHIADLPRSFFYYVYKYSPCYLYALAPLEHLDVLIIDVCDPKDRRSRDKRNDNWVTVATRK